MAAGVLLLLLLGTSSSFGPGFDRNSEQGRMELRRVRGLAAQPLYGECWARALEHLDVRCRDLTAEGQSRVALRFTHCHLSSSGRSFPSCPQGSEVSACTGAMDAAAFHTYTEFFTHTHAICSFLQSEAWRGRAETTMHRLTESSAGVAEQLQSTRLMAEDLIEAQSAALQAQQEILTNGEELRATLRDSTEGLRSVFQELRSTSQEQQVVLSELFNRVSFLQSLLLMEAHSLSSCCYHAAALCASYLITSTRRSSSARLPLLCLVCLNFLLEEKLSHLLSDRPEHQTEVLAACVAVLRRVTACVGLAVLTVACVRYRDPIQQSLQVLQELKEAQHRLQEALLHAESLGDYRRKEETPEGRRSESRRRRREELQRRNQQEEERPPVTPPTDISSSFSSSSPLIYSILVEDKQSGPVLQPRYPLRSRRSEVH